jgi:AraC-like DNA-binding protein
LEVDKVQNETAGEAFQEYGVVYKNMSDEKRENLVCQTLAIPAQKSLSQFLHFSCAAYVEVQRGTGILLVSHDPENAKIDEFGLNQRVHINPNIYFAFVATTPELVINVYVDRNHSLDALTLSTPYEFHPVLPRIQIQDILGYYYRIRTPGYQFKGERHPFFELTYVDTGILHTEVDGVQYTLGEKEMIIYGPGQFHTQHADEEQSVSYVTILFDMENLTPEIPDDWYAMLLNKVFPYHKKTYTLIKTLVQESSTGIPYVDSLMLCLLTETIIRLLQSEYMVSTFSPSTVARQNYRDELFEQIIAYVESKIYEPLTIADICQRFSMSRSSLQLLFKNTVNQSPKKYVSDMKLERSRQMLRENKYTVSEISLKLGYSSIHYFSNAFNQKYHISPSEYARRMY